MNWFKFYPDELDSAELYSILEECPAALDVYLLILSRQCRDTIGTNVPILSGHPLCKVLGLSQATVEQAVGLLAASQFIIQQDGQLAVPNWNSRESEYAQRRRARMAATHAPPSAPQPPRKRLPAPAPPQLVGGTQLKPTEAILRQKELDRVEKRMSAIRSNYSEHQAWSVEDKREWAVLNTRKKELVKLLGLAV
jgi:DNA-binding transcriptional MocR family regulator